MGLLDLTQYLDTGYDNEGNYTCTSKNNAAGNSEVSDSSSQKVQISKSVLISLTPSRLDICNSPIFYII